MAEGYQSVIAKIKFANYKWRDYDDPPPTHTHTQIDRVVTIMQNPRQYKIPDWFLNRQKDTKDGKYTQILANQLEHKLREDLERLKKIRAHRGLRHYWG